MSETPLFSRRAFSVAILFIAVLASVSLFALNGFADRSRKIENLVTATSARAFELSALEWRMIAEETVDAATDQKLTEVSEAINQSVNQILELGGTGVELQNVRTALDMYLTAINEEVLSLKSGDIETAMLLDEERVDPAFEELDGALATANNVYSQRAANIRIMVNILSILLLIGGGALIASLVDRNRQAQIEIVRSSFEKDALTQATQHNEELTINTNTLNRRNAYLLTASRVARQAASVHDLNALLNNVTRLIADQFGFYHVGLFLLDANNEFAILQAASSEGGQRMIARGHRLQIGSQGIVGYVAAQKHSRIILDTGKDAISFDNPDLPDTRSETALPLFVRERVIGVLDIQSEKPMAFTPEDTDSLQILADQLALAIENARLIEEMNSAVLQLEQTMERRVQDSWSDVSRSKVSAYQYTPLGTQQITKQGFQADDGKLRVPITLHNQKIGEIKVKRKDSSDHWDARERGMLEEIAIQVGLALENARLLDDAQKRAARERSISEISARIGAAHDVDAILRMTAQEIGKAIGDSEITVQIRAEDREVA